VAIIIADKIGIAQLCWQARPNTILIGVVVEECSSLSTEVASSTWSTSGKQVSAAIVAVMARTY
jgi:hypothetical protein